MLLVVVINSVIYHNMCENQPRKLHTLQPTSFSYQRPPKAELPRKLASCESPISMSRSERVKGRYNTYSTHQVPLLLEERIGEDVVRARVPIVDPLAAGGNRTWVRKPDKVLVEGGVVALFTNLFVLLLHPSHLEERGENEGGKFVI